MKMLYITHGFPPVRHSGTFRAESFVRYLPEFGIEPLVFCAADDCDVLTYEHGTDTDEYPGVLRLPWKPRNLGVRLPAWHRMFLRLPLGATLANRYARHVVAAVLSERVQKWLCGQRVRAILASGPPPEAVVIGERLSCLTGLPLVADLRDPWTYYPYAKYRHWVDFAFERSFERKVLSRCRIVIANNPTAKTLLTDEVGLSTDKVVVLPNGYDELDFSACDGTESHSPDRFRIVYTGLLHTSLEKRARLGAVKRALALDYQPVRVDANARSPLHFLRAMESLLDRRPDMRGSVAIVFVGPLSADDRRALTTFRYPECLSILGPVPHQRAIRECCGADLCLLLQAGMWIGREPKSLCVPGKLFDYLRSGTDIIAPLQEGDATDLIRRLNAGRAMDPYDTRAMASYVEERFDRWKAQRGERPAREAVASLFDRRKISRQLANIILNAIGEGDPRDICDTWPSAA